MISLQTSAVEAKAHKAGQTHDYILGLFHNVNDATQEFGQVK